jgi:hypothetical protein
LSARGFPPCHINPPMTLQNTTIDPTMNSIDVSFFPAQDSC